MADEKPVSSPTPIEMEKGLEEAEIPQSFGKIVLQFFVIPMLIVAFCVAIVFVFRWLTFEQRSVDEYLVMLKQSTGTAERGQAAKNLLTDLMSYIPESKRWQGIYDVTQQLRTDKEKFLREHPNFTEKVIDIFENSQDDPKVRRYLALTLGIIGNEKASAALIKAVGDTDTETQIAALIAIGNVRDQTSLPVILQAARSDDAGVRQTAIYVLGAFDDAELARPLEAALNDSDELVTWNAAFALARRGSNAGEKVLTRLLDFEYVSKRGAITVAQRQQYRVAAIQQLAKLDAASLVPQFEKLSTTDPDMPVRQAAIEALKMLRK
ncbi:MAG: HEAT repeat domain-containing protein [Verrucomicrobiae bacterium]|nr:HEAT repeat domain-containing protein [Verrucomicrobiae bacterium]